MAIVNVTVKEAVFYYPDGPNTPLTLQFPLSTTVPNGSRIKLANHSTSATPVTFLAQGSDTIADPSEVTVMAASHDVAIPELIIEYMLVGTEWLISGHGDPDLAKQTLATFAFAAYGGLYLSAPVASGDIGATWDTIDVFDTVVFSTPKFITQDIPSASLQLVYPGVYTVNMMLNYSHNESNSSRVTNLRIYNLTDATPGSSIEIPIARNQPGTLISVPLLSEVLAGKQYVLQIGNGDAISAVIVRAARFTMNGAGEFRGDLNAF